MLVKQSKWKAKMEMFHLDQPNTLEIHEHGEYFQSFPYLIFLKNETRKEEKYMVVQFLGGLELPM